MTNSTPKNKGSKKQTSGRGSSDVFQSDKKDQKDHVNEHALPDPLITNGECERCPFNGDIVSECISCSICCKQFHALCRNKKGAFSSSSICSKTFFDMYAPLSAHYGSNKARWGQFIFICNLCNSKYPGLFPKSNGTNDLIDVVSLVQSPTKYSPVSKSNETQTLISGSLNGYNSDCDSEHGSAGSPGVLNEINKLTKLSEAVLENIKCIQNLSDDHAKNFTNKIDCLKSELLSGNIAQKFSSQSQDTSQSQGIDSNPATSTNFDFNPQLCKAYKVFEENILDDDLLANIVGFLDKFEDFKEIKSSNNNSSRDVAYFGDFKYRYGSTQHEARNIPDIIQPVIDLMSEKFPKSMINSCLVTRYKDGSNTCPPHSDDEPFIAPWSDIFTLSIGSERTMVFNSCNDDSLSLNLSNNSLLAFSRASQNFWKHGIPSTDSATVRYSLTFRQLAPYYANSTLIVGDSNTEMLKFGSGRSTFGVWMPGCRVKAGKIRDIPGPSDIDFPYRHLVIHCGINDLRNQNHLPIPVLMGNLKEKCLALISKFPKMRIHLSMLLPTKDIGLNAMVSEFNRRIKDFSDNHANISTISHSNIADSSGKLSHELGRHNRDGRPAIFDNVHLGSKGISLFCANIKNCIVKKRTTNGNINNDSKVNSETRFPYWNPNPNYKPATYTPLSHPYPWTGDHGAGFSASNPQHFHMNNLHNGYQS